MPRVPDRLLTADLAEDPHPLFAQLRREAPVWQVPGEPGDVAFLVTTWEQVADAAGRVEDFSNHFRHVLFTHDDGRLGVLASGGHGPDVFAGADPPAHTEHRRIFFSELVRTKIDAQEPFVTAVADDLLDVAAAASPSGSTDLALHLTHPLPLRVVSDRVIGFRDVDLARLRRWVFDGSRLVGGRLTLEEMATGSADVAGMAEWTAAQLDAALAAPNAGDVLGASAAAVRDGRLSHDEAAFNLMVLAGAGAETTTGLLGAAIALLADHAALQAELRDEPARLPAFIEEVLRFASPFRYHPRTAARDTELAGVGIPEGALVLLAWSSANRDDAVFDRPDELRVGRENVHLHMGFGRGIHHCVGAPLARLEARVVLARLLARTTSFALDPANAPTWTDSIWIHRHERLPLVVDWR